MALFVGHLEKTNNSPVKLNWSDKSDEVGDFIVMSTASWTRKHASQDNFTNEKHDPLLPLCVLSNGPLMEQLLNKTFQSKN